jgi:hypothetical protein
MTNNKKERSTNCQKQSQTNPIYSVFIRVNSWLISKRTQTKPNLPAIAGKFALPALECRYRGSAVEGPVVSLPALSFVEVSNLFIKPGGFILAGRAVI